MTRKEEQKGKGGQLLLSGIPKTRPL